MGKALVYFMAEDINAQFITHTSRAGIDGKWMGAAYGSSYFSFSVDPGPHPLCATMQIGTETDDDLIGLAQFTAQAGGAYYFEMKNVSMQDASLIYSNDANLFAIDSDEGAYLASWLMPVESREKK